MGFQIEVSTGDAGPVVMRGCEDGTIEFCKWQVKKDKETGEETGRELVAYKWYASLEQAWERVFRMRVCSSNAATIKELVQAVKQTRAEIRAELGLGV